MRAKIILMGLVCFPFCQFFGQKELIMEKIKPFHLDEYHITHLFENGLKKFQFQEETTIESSVENTKTTTSLSSYSPTNDEWKLISINQNPPSQKEIKQFIKDKKRIKLIRKIKIDHHSWKIETDNDSLLVISFHYIKNNLPKDLKILGKCKTNLYLNKITNRLYKVSIENQEKFRLKLYKINKIYMEEYFNFDELTAIYLSKSEFIYIQLKFLNQYIDVKQKKFFSNYQYSKQ